MQKRWLNKVILMIILNVLFISVIYSANYPTFNIKVKENGKALDSFVENNTNDPQLSKNILTPVLEIQAGTQAEITVSGDLLQDRLLYKFIRSDEGVVPNPNYTTDNDNWDRIGDVIKTGEITPGEEVLSKQRYLNVDFYSNDLNPLNDDNAWTIESNVFNTKTKSYVREAKSGGNELYDDGNDILGNPNFVFYPYIEHSDGGEGSKLSSITWGYMKVDNTDWYTFATLADDGVNVYIEDIETGTKAQVISEFEPGATRSNGEDCNKFDDGNFEIIEESGHNHVPVELIEGKIYKIEIKWFTYGTGGALQLFYKNGNDENGSISSHYDDGQGKTVLDDNNYKEVPSEWFYAKFETTSEIPAKYETPDVTGTFNFPVSDGYYYILLDIATEGDVNTDIGIRRGAIYGPFLIKTKVEGLPGFEIKTDVNGNKSFEEEFSDHNAEGEPEINKIETPEVEINEEANATLTIEGTLLDTGEQAPIPGQYYQIIYTGDNSYKPDYPEDNSPWKLIGIPEITIIGGEPGEEKLADQGFLNVDIYNVDHLKSLDDESKWTDPSQVFSNRMNNSPSKKKAFVLENAEYDWDNERNGQNANVRDSFDSGNGPENAFFNLLYNENAENSDKFAMKTWGYFVPEKDGEYKFGAYMDDGVKIYLTVDGERVVMLDDFRTGEAHMTQGGNVVNLKAGKAYKIELEWFSWGTAHALRLYYSSDTNNWNWDLVPEDFFYASMEKTEGTPIEKSSGSVSKNVKFPKDPGYYYIALNIYNGGNQRKVMQGPFYLAPQVEYPTFKIAVENKGDGVIDNIPFVVDEVEGPESGIERRRKSPLEEEEGIKSKLGARINKDAMANISVEGSRLKVDGQWYQFYYMENDYNKSDGNNGWHTGSIPLTVPGLEDENWKKIGDVSSTGANEDDVDRSKMGNLYSRKFNVDHLTALNDSQWVDRESVFKDPDQNALHMTTGEENNYNNEKQDVFSQRIDTGDNTAAYKFWGYMIPEESGDYRFRFISDDGIKAYFQYGGSMEIIANSFVPQSSVTVGGDRDFSLTGDTPYAIQIEWFNYGGSQELRMEYQKDGSSWDDVPAEWFCPSIDITPGDGANVLTPTVESRFEFPDDYGHYYVELDIANDFGNGKEYKREVIYGPFTLPKPMEVIITNPKENGTFEIKYEEKEKAKTKRYINVKGSVIDEYYPIDKVIVAIVKTGTNPETLDYSDIKNNQEVIASGLNKYNNGGNKSIKEINYDIDVNYYELAEAGNIFDVIVIGYNDEGDHNYAVVKNVILDIYPVELINITVKNVTLYNFLSELSNEAKPVFSESELLELTEMTYDEGALSEYITGIRDQSFGTKVSYLKAIEDQYCYFKPNDKLDISIEFIEPASIEGDIIELNLAGNTLTGNLPTGELKSLGTGQNIRVYTMGFKDVEVAESSLGIMKNLEFSLKVKNQYENIIESKPGRIDAGIYDNKNPNETDFKNSDQITNLIKYKEENSLDIYTNGSTNVSGDSGNEYTLKFESSDYINEYPEYNPGIVAYVMVYQYEIDGERKRIGSSTGTLGNHDLDIDSSIYKLAATKANENLGELKKKIDTSDKLYDDGIYYIKKILAIDKAGNVLINSGEVSQFNKLGEVVTANTVKILHVDTNPPDLTNSKIIKVHGLFGKKTNENFRYEPIIIDERAVKYGDAFKYVLNISETNFSKDVSNYNSTYAKFINGLTAAPNITVITEDKNSYFSVVEMGDKNHHGKYIELDNNGNTNFLTLSDDESIGVTKLPDSNIVEEELMDISVTDLAGNKGSFSYKFELDSTPPARLNIEAFAEEVYTNNSAYNTIKGTGINIKDKSLQELYDFDIFNEDFGNKIIHYTKAETDTMYLSLYQDNSDIEDLKVLATSLRERRINGTFEEGILSNVKTIKKFSRIYENDSDTLKVDAKTDYQGLIAFSARELILSNILDKNGNTIDSTNGDKVEIQDSPELIFDTYANSLNRFNIVGIDNAGWPTGKYVINGNEITEYEIFGDDYEDIKDKTDIIVDRIVTERSNEISGILEEMMGTSNYIGIENNSSFKFEVELNFEDLYEYSGLWKYKLLRIEDNIGEVEYKFDGSLNEKSEEQIFNNPYNNPAYYDSEDYIKNGISFSIRPTNKRNSDANTKFEFKIPQDSILLGSRSYIIITLWDNLNNEKDFKIPIFIPKQSLELKSRYEDINVAREKKTDIKVIGEQKFEVQSAKEAGRTMFDTDNE